MALLDMLAERAGRHAGLVADRSLSLAQTAWAEVPSIKCRRDGDELIISGRGLMRRWLSDLRLRFLLLGRR